LITIVAPMLHQNRLGKLRPEEEAQPDDETKGMRRQALNWITRRTVSQAHPVRWN